MNIFQKILMGFGCLGMLWLGSCTILGVGSVVALNAATSPENIERINDAAEERETARHNERMNDEANDAIEYNEAHMND